MYMIQIENVHRYSSRTPKQIFYRWLGQWTASWQSAPNHNVVLSLHPCQELLVPSGGPCRRITDSCSASLEERAGQRGVQPQPCADLQGLLMAAVPPLSPDSSADTPLHKGVWGGPLHENLEYSFPWVDFCWDHLTLSGRIYSCRSSKDSGFWFLSFHDVPGHPSETDDCLHQGGGECLAPQKIPIGHDTGALYS